MTRTAFRPVTPRVKVWKTGNLSPTQQSRFSIYKEAYKTKIIIHTVMPSSEISQGSPPFVLQPQPQTRTLIRTAGGEKTKTNRKKYRIYTFSSLPRVYSKTSKVTDVRKRTQNSSSHSLPVCGCWSVGGPSGRGSSFLATL